MDNNIDNYFLTLPEPDQSALLFIHYFLTNDVSLQTQRKNNTPFYYYNGKWFCFLNYHPKTREINISFVKGNQVTHPKLVSEGRKQMKIYKIDPAKTISVKELKAICTKLKNHY